MTRRKVLAALIALVVLGCGQQLVARHGKAEPVVEVAAAAPITTTTEAPTTTTTTATVVTTTTSTTRAPQSHTSRSHPLVQPTTTTTNHPQADESAVKWEGVPSDCNPHINHDAPGAGGKSASDHCWQLLVAHWDWPQQHMLWIIWCESKGNQDARNSSGAHGLFQDMNGPMDPWENAVTAYYKWTHGGNSHWAESKPCWGGH